MSLKREISFAFNDLIRRDVDRMTRCDVRIETSIAFQVVPDFPHSNDSCIATVGLNCERKYDGNTNGIWFVDKLQRKLLAVANILNFMLESMSQGQSSEKVF